MTPTKKKWDVFISFRGKDTRRGFLSFLFRSLKEKGIDTFKDEKLQKGAEITPSLLQTIQESCISIVIFSKNYADSPWCLDELVQINECRENSGQMVVPVFYRIDPTDVQGLGGSYKKSLHKLKKEHKCKLRRWRKALKTISNELSGWVSKEIKDYQTLVHKIVDDVWEKLSHMSSDVNYEDRLVGIDSRAEEVKSLLDVKANDRRTVGIWGMSGIGKTTLASKIHLELKAKFDGDCFVPNVSEEIRKENPIFSRDKIIRQLLRDESLEIGTSLLSGHIKRRLGNKKVLMVFDDIAVLNQLDLLAGNCNLYGEGSRIIVTCTDRHVLVNVCDEEHIYEVKELGDDEALRLFCWFAFHQNEPIEGYVVLSNNVISYAQGNPLALRVLGSNFCGLEIEDWESELAKLQCIPDMEILQVLKVGYERLDRDAQQIFLDIACFFNWNTMDEVERILEGFGFFARRGIRRLLDKSLVTISGFHGDQWEANTRYFQEEWVKKFVNEERKNDGGRSRLWSCKDFLHQFKTHMKLQGLGVRKVFMHNLLQQMGKEIVNEECKNPGGRSRLWSSKDILRVFKTDSGTEYIEGISLDMYAIGSIELSSKAFSKMHSLRFLRFSGCYCGFADADCSIRYILPDGLDFLPKQLTYVDWKHFPLKSLPLKFCPNNLVELRLDNGHLEQLWLNRDEPFGNLKVLSLNYCKSLKRISNSFQAPKLEEFYLMGCEKLVEIPSLVHCERLESLQLDDCSKLEECPDVPCNLRSLYLGGTLIKQLPSSIQNCSRLVKLSLGGCRELENVPDFIGQLESLEHLSLGDCSKLSWLPESILQLNNLKYFCVEGCLKLGDLPSNFGELRSLKGLWMSKSGIKTLPASINQMRNLETLHCEECEGLTTLPPLTGLNSLQFLYLYNNCGISEISESIGSLVSLKHLYLQRNKFESLPSSFRQLSNLKYLSLRHCERLRNLPELPKSLIEFDAFDCTSLEFALCPFLSQQQEEKGGVINFASCTNLNKEVRIKIMEDALSYSNRKEFLLLIPGVEMWQKMRYKTSGAHISFKLERQHRIVGFYFSVVCDFYAEDDITCDVRFVDTFGETHHFQYPLKVWQDLSSEHVLTWYRTFDCKEHFIFTHYSMEFRRGGVIGCGVEPRLEVFCPEKELVEDQ